MKHKYLIQPAGEQNILTIKEYGELDKDILTFVCEQKYEEQKIKSAVSQSKEALIQVLRTENMYPSILYINAIADTIIGMYGDNLFESKEVLLDDLDFISKDHEKAIIDDETADRDTDDIDDLLEDDFPEPYDDKNDIDNINSSLKVAEDEILDVDDDA